MISDFAPKCDVADPDFFPEAGPEQPVFPHSIEPSAAILLSLDSRRSAVPISVKNSARL
jgi:hypothetical protein